MTTCTDETPPWFTGHWRDWHRGHDCEHDDGKPRTTEGTAEIDAYASQVAAGRANDLTDLELDRLEKNYGDHKPTRNCHVCGGAEWSLHATGGGRETWYCKAASDGRPMDWDHFGNSKVEVASGDEDVVRLVREVREARAYHRDMQVFVTAFGTEHHNLAAKLQCVREDVEWLLEETGTRGTRYSQISDDLSAPLSEVSPSLARLTFGELAVGDHFIAFPLPGDNAGHGGYRAEHHVFKKADDEHALDRRGVTSHMPTAMAVIQVSR